MDDAAFRASLSDDHPPAASDPALQALWWAGKGAWDRAHETAQQHEGDRACDLVHAYLHRLEGDAGNAAYWYRRAGRAMATGDATAEWAALVSEMLARV